ncbi:hypothetical protein IWQ56_005188, partial [Coemansia nantahalensis]
AAHLLLGDYDRRGGMVGAVEAHAAEGEAPLDDIALINSFNRKFGGNASFVPGPPANKRDRQPAQFGVRHYLGTVMYNADGLCRHNMDLEVSPDFYSLAHGASRSRLVRQMFGLPLIALDYHPEDESTIVGTFLSTRPLARPTVRRPAKAAAAAAAAAAGRPPHPLAVQALEAPAELPPADSADPANTFVGEVAAALEDVLAAASHCKIWHVMHIRPDNPGNLGSLLGVPDRQFIRQQVQGMGLVDMSRRRAPAEFTVGFAFDAFIERYAQVISLDLPADAGGASEQALAAPALVERVAAARRWVLGQHYVCGHRTLFMTERVWRSIDVELRALHRDRQRTRGARPARPPAGSILGALAAVGDAGELERPHMALDNASTIYGSEVDTSDGLHHGDNDDDDDDGLFSGDEYGDSGSDYCGFDDGRSSDGRSRGSCDYTDDRRARGSTEQPGGKERWGEVNPEHGNFDGDYGAVRRTAAAAAAARARREGLVEELETTPARRCWSRTAACLTFPIPDWLIGCCGMKREDIRMAWREKVSICVLILLMWGFVLFFIIGLGLLMCPRQYVYNMDEVAGHTERSDAFVAMRGHVYDIT